MWDTAARYLIKGHTNMEQAAIGSTAVGVPSVVRLSARARVPVPLAGLLTVIGAKRGVEIRIKSQMVSGAHAAMVNIDNTVYIRDLCSRIGIFVNDKPVREARLFHDDVVRVGPCRYRFSDAGVLRRVRDHIKAPPAVIQVSGIPSPVSLSGRMTLIGRREDADLVLAGKEVSIAHAIILEVGLRHVICDLHSRFGTMVNGSATTTHALSSGDVIRIGGIDLVYRSDHSEVAFAENTDFAGMRLRLESESRASRPAAPDLDMDETADSASQADSMMPEAHPSAMADMRSDSVDFDAIEPPGTQPLRIDFSHVDSLPEALFADSNTELPLMYTDDEMLEAVKRAAARPAPAPGLAGHHLAPRRGYNRWLIAAMLVLLALVAAAVTTVAINPVIRKHLETLLK